MTATAARPAPAATASPRGPAGSAAPPEPAASAVGRPDAAGLRLGFNDDMYLRVGRVLGTPMLNQVLWRFDRPLEDLDLEGLRDCLAAGPLSRLVERARVPAARDRWIPAPVSSRQLQISPTCSSTELRDWFDDVIHTHVDPEVGPPWVLHAVPFSDGGCAVSLLASHAVCDGTLLFPTIDAAARGEVLPGVTRQEPATLRRRADVSDAIGQLRAAGAGVQAAWRSRRAISPGTGRRSGVSATGSGESGAAPAPVQPGHSAAPGRSVSPRRSVAPERSTSRAESPDSGRDTGVTVAAPTAFLDVPLAAWDTVAAEHSGTRNSLLIAFTASLWQAARGLQDGTTVKVAIPVATRTEDDQRANTTVGVQVPVTVGADLLRDLGPVRSASRTAFADLAAGDSTTVFQQLKPLFQMLPDRAVAKLASGLAESGCTASNVGVIPSAMGGLGGVQARTIVMRTIPQRMTATTAQQLGGGVTCWLSVHGESLSVVVQSLDLDRHPNSPALCEIVREQAARWGLEHTVW